MKRLASFVVTTGLFLPILASAPAKAQTATRTWVSGVGDDINACSRISPCKTFAGAISKTTTNGEINCLDPGGYGPVTITKSITIDCSGTNGAILVAGSNGININLDFTPSMIVRLRGLNINGTLAGSNTKGISMTGANGYDNAVSIEDCVIDGFTANGILSSAKNGRLLIKNTTVRNNYAAAVSIAPVSGATTLKVTMDNVSTFDSGYGFAFGNGSQALIKNSIASQNVTAGVEADAGATVAVVSTAILGNGTGILANTGSTIRVRDSDISYNPVGVSGTIQSHVNNSFMNNGPGGTITPVAGGVANPQGLQ